MCDRPAVFLGVAPAMALNHAICCADGITSSSGQSDVTTQQVDTMKIRLTVNGKAMTATLIDSGTTQDFISL